MKPNRRKFLRDAFVLGASGLFLPRLVRATECVPFETYTTVVPSPTVLWWKLAEAASGNVGSVTDSTSNGYGGAASGTTVPTYIANAGPSANARGVTFESSSNAVIASTSATLTAFQNLATASLAGWFYRSGTSDSFAFGMLSSTGYRFGYLCESGGSTCYCFVEANGASNYPNITVPATAGWHHIATTFAGSGPTQRVYVDGVQQTLTAGGAGTPTTTASATSAGNFNIGHDPTDSYYALGQYSDLRLYNITLSPIQVATLYANGPS